MFVKIWQLIFESFKIWSDARASQMAAATTYYAMLSLAPTLMIAIAIASYIFDGQLAEAEILEATREFTTPENAQIIAGLIQRASLPQSGIVAGTFSIGIFLIGASGVFSQLYDTFNYIWHVDAKKQGFWFGVQKRGIGILMVLMAGLLLVGALALNSLQGYVTELADGYQMLQYWLNLADRGVTFLLFPIMFSLLFWFVPATKVRIWDVVPAGILTSMMVLGSRYIIQLYVKFSSTSEVYGAAGSLVVMLIWIYIITMVLFYGASFSHAWSLTFGSRASEKLAANVQAGSQNEGASQTPAQPDQDLPALVPERRVVNSTNEPT